MEPKTSLTHKSIDSPPKFDETTDEIMDVTTIVNQIDSLESTMKLMFDHIKHMANMQTQALGKMTTTNPDIELIEAGLDAPKTSTKIPLVGPMRWQLKDLKLSKSIGNASACSTNAIEQWLSKWEQCFQLCRITDDEIKIQHATYNLLNVAHR